MNINIIIFNRIPLLFSQCKVQNKIGKVLMVCLPFLMTTKPVAGFVLSKPNTIYSSMHIRLRLDIVLTWSPPHTIDMEIILALLGTYNTGEIPTAKYGTQFWNWTIM